MAIDYHSFEIEVLEQDAETFLVKAEVDGATRKEEIPASLPLLDPREIQQAHGWLERGFIDREYARDFGRRLFQTLFPGQVGALFGEAIQRAGQQGGVRVILKFPMPAALMGLPWELMVADGQGLGFLARSSQAPLVRHYAGLPLPFLPPEEGPLRVLLVIASPQDKPPVSGAQEVEAITKALNRPGAGFLDAVKSALAHLVRQRSPRGLIRRLRQRRLVEIETLDHATRGGLQACLLKARNEGRGFHVIHFIGHAQAGPQGSEVLLEGAGRQADPIPADELAEQLAEPTVNLVVLNACETASGLEFVQSIALAILSHKVPAVIGMQTPILDRSALEFGRELYAAWAAGEPLEAALAYARRQVGREYQGSVSDWSIPVLYMSPTEGLTLRLAPPALKSPTPLRILRWGIAALLSLLGTVALLLQVPDIARTIRTELPVIRCIYPYPMPKQPSFNVAVAEFGVARDEGSPRASAEGLALASYISRRLGNSFNDYNFIPINYEIRPADQTCGVKGKTEKERRDNAAKLAKRIGAHMVIYGTITKTGGRNTFSPEFYVNPDQLSKALEITGQHDLGRPLRLPEPLDVDELHLAAIPGLYARNQALVLVTIGLAYYSMDNFAEAQKVFKAAEGISGWTENAGKEVLYLLQGNTAARLMSREVTTLAYPDYLALMDEARRYYQAAMDAYQQESHKDYLRAKIGLGGILINQALGNPQADTLNYDLQILDQAKSEFDHILAEAAALKESTNPADALDQANLETTNIETKARLERGRLHMAKGQVSLSQPETAKAEFSLAEADFALVIQDFDQGDQHIQDLASQALASQGLVDMLLKDYTAAIPHFQRAMELASPFYKGRYSSFLGACYYYSGQVDKAVQAYEEAVQYAELAGDNDLIRQAGEMLQFLSQDTNLLPTR